VQNSASFIEFQPVSPDIIKKQIAAVLEDEKPGAAKLGMLGSAELVHCIVDALSKAEIPIIVDPVLSSSTGHSLVDEELLDAYKQVVFPASSIVTPNAHEASIITGLDVTGPESAGIACQQIYDMGPGSVLVKGGHFTTGRGTDIFYDGTEFYELVGQEVTANLRGTGCTLSSLIAGHVSRGLDPTSAVRAAKRDFSRAMMNSSQHGNILTFNDSLDPGKAGMRNSLNDAISEILAIMPSGFIAEVGNNLAFAERGASGPEGICSLDSRLLAKGGHVVTLGTPVFGRKSHVGRVVLAAMSGDPEMRCAMNLRYSDELVGLLKNSGFSIGNFSRAEQPEDSSSMEWGTGKAISDVGFVPDVVFDRGGVGKEPMIRLLARDPGELLTKLRRIVDTYQETGAEP
jgi:hydroxymethylpyrimidine/phosphomethylpyrimidine kinase